jgi:uncharacterized RDD family membrane protein YckC
VRPRLGYYRVVLRPVDAARLKRLQLTVVPVIVIMHSMSQDELIGSMSLDRFFAAIIDNVLAIVVAFIVAVKLASYGEVVSWAGAAVSYFGYYFLSEVVCGNTVGKWSSGLCVRAVSGERCSRSQMSIRTLLRVLEVNPLLFGALPAGIAIFLSRRRQRIGDAIAGTVVVRRSQII